MLQPLGKEPFCLNSRIDLNKNQVTRETEGVATSQPQLDSQRRKTLGQDRQLWLDWFANSVPNS